MYVIYFFAEFSQMLLEEYIPDINAVDQFNRDRIIVFERIGQKIPEIAAEDGAGNIWCGTKVGLSRWDGAESTTFTTADGLASDQVLSLLATGLFARTLCASAVVTLRCRGTFSAGSSKQGKKRRASAGASWVSAKR